MNVSAFCIRHPVATILMSASLVLAGLFAWRFLPVAALPRAEFPVVNVSAQLPGASPDTSQPLARSRTTSGTPPTYAATTQRAAAIASSSV